MKSLRIKNLLVIFLIGVFSIGISKKTSAQVNVGVSFDLFYNELAPYGQWGQDQSYGDIWFPNVSSDFRPYGTNGYWTMTEYGNTWVSNYAWGWAPFHYGRWVHTNYNGWGWIPGYEWGPAWVDWRSGNDYYGWAPMPPRTGVTVSVNLPFNLWVFVPSRHIYHQRINRYWSYGQRNIYNRTTIINNTYVVNNNHYHGGPRRADIERSIGKRVEVRNVRSSSRPGATRVDSRSVALYRPANGTRTSGNNVRNNSSNSNKYDFRTTTRSEANNNERTATNSRSTSGSTPTSTSRQSTARAQQNTRNTGAPTHTGTARGQGNSVQTPSRNTTTTKQEAKPSTPNRSGIDTRSKSQIQPQRGTTTNRTAPSSSQSRTRSSNSRQQTKPAQSAPRQIYQSTSNSSSRPSGSATVSSTTRNSSSSRTATNTSKNSSRSSSRGSR